MSYQPFPIVDYASGLFTAKEPWLAPKDAFQRMDNACVKRGRIKKRKGSKLLCYAPYREGSPSGWADDGSDNVEVTLTGHSLATGDYIIVQGTSGNGSSSLNDKRFFITKTGANTFTLDDITWSGLHATPAPTGGTVDQVQALSKAAKINAAGVTEANPAVVTTASAHGLSTGDTVQIVQEEGSNISGMTEILNVVSTVTVLTTTKFELDCVDSTNFTTHVSGGTVATVTLTADPIVGMHEYKKADGTTTFLIATTTRLSEFDGTKANATALSTSDQFAGSSTQYFQFTNFGDTAYFTNFVDTPFEWTGSGAPSAHSFGSTGVTKCRLIFAYKQRLIVLNTVEGGTNFPQRLRWTAILTSPTATPDWDNGSALDASTADAIIGAKFLKDTLVVFFEESVWAIKDTGSKDIPFRWEKIDDLSTLIEAQHSVIGHENAVWGFGRAGWILCDSFQVKGFDTPIPDFPEEIAPDNRTILFSERNLTEKQIWMAFPCCNNSTNNEVLVYNFETPSFCNYDLAYNVAAEFNKQTAGATWDDINEPWDAINQSWDSFITSAGFPELLIGQGSGMIKRVNQGSTDDGAAIDFDVLSSRWTPFPDAQAQLGWIDFLVTAMEDGELNVEVYSDWDPTLHVSGVLPLGGDFSGQEKVWKRFYVNITAPTFRVRMHHKQPYDVQIHATIPYFRKAGRLT